MKKYTGDKIRLGVFVTFGVALFIIGIYYIGARQELFSNTFRVTAVFKDVNGLIIGNNIRFSGINVGIIKNIEIINDSAVKVDMLIEENVRKFIKRDATASIASDGLMGNKIVVIYPGTGGQKEIMNNDNIKTVVPVKLDDILTSLKVTTDNTANISGDLSTIMSNIRSGKGTIGKLFMDTVFAENIDQTVVNVKQGTGAFKKNMDAAKNSFLLRGTFRDSKTKKNPSESEDQK